MSIGPSSPAALLSSVDSRILYWDTICGSLRTDITANYAIPGSLVDMTFAEGAFRYAFPPLLHADDAAMCWLLEARLPIGEERFQACLFLFLRLIRRSDSNL